jgi:hypothetical protein
MLAPMDRKDVQQMLESMRTQLERDEAAGEMAGIDVSALADAVSHPKAPDVIGQIMEIEATSVQEGEAAPDFTLPWLGAKPAGAGERLTLSSHFGRRPVALIFGSYT